MHKALYRAYRPQNFKDVVGQNHIIRTLKNQIQNNNVGHAYLFCGTRGTGKTSTAKIFARAVNCENSIDEEPCNECEVCKDILNDNIMDVIEIDAASNNSVDDIREIRENVKYTPAKCKYKVYIIDEVHMLSQGAFNALLKTLEEPPSYVIFILATTEPHKIPATILSRCQRFDFKRVTVKDMATRMKEICEDVNIEVDERALNLIARNSQGALRDALSILDQCMSFSEGNIEYKDVVDLLGTVNIEQLFEMAEYVIKEDTKKCLEILNEFVIWGKDIKNFVDDLIDHFRNLMVCKVSKDLDEIISLPDETVELLKSQSSLIETNEIIRILNILSTTQDAIKSSTNPRVLAEVSIMKLSQPMFDDSKEALLKRISTLEETIRSGNIKINNIETKESIEVEKEIVQEQPKEEVYYEEVKSEDVKLIEKSWENILMHIKKDKNMPVYAILREAREFNVNSNNLYIMFDDNFAFAKNKLSDSNTLEYVESIVRETINRSFSIKIILRSESKNIKLEIEKEEKDKGEEILEEVFPKEILDIKESIAENEIK
ncbi:DNA polymerase III subunits gamma and tau,DNA polymerase III subunit tau,DNA polymerase III subunits gamma and tau,Holliday junction resolvasome, helicase subunit,DNA polymerase III, subunit gamma and tau,DNA polymerase III subunits gamma and tau domain III [[Clostridium] sordellii]|uniref:DNA polymerase III subunit gamma/tau n=1 Tax=Paraclostridium sordellii TaxID=1505 RepID=UPI0005444C8C|nr:DNA polymerase III subunit gamma/tau [Paeniclostridium sordellii]CEK35486.1 DNA polymerase III subunits gamma and tau,DNA polymerase III subunit tau,DNA polymerase III subunits gamma and tau,Holliday junction resolvasome, helicase subunit,DNA polymerase III, subunit gamma and tau,DNA polymerase III subunits gamma and tau domain III [[Clostridium] sordellii] [Paeniclostridium sordellii]